MVLVEGGSSEPPPHQLETVCRDYETYMLLAFIFTSCMQQ